MEESTSSQVSAPSNNRIMVFIDFWNVQLWLNRRERERTGAARFDIDWEKFPAALVRQAADLCSLARHSYEGCHVYASFNSSTPQDVRLHRWLTTWLNTRPGVRVVAKPRRVKNAPECPSCGATIAECPVCAAGLRGTEEKGIDAPIATDMIRLAWEGTYDIAVLASSDTDLIPAVQFLDLRGRKVIQAGFPPSARELASACWASFDLFLQREEFRRIAGRQAARGPEEPV